MTDIERLLEDLELQLDVLETAIGSGHATPLPADFDPPPDAVLTEADRARAEALQKRLLAAQTLVAGELERTRQQLGMAEGGPDEPPRFLDTTF